LIHRDDPKYPGFFSRLGYDATLESAAFERLAAGEVDACRAALWSLVAGLELPTSETDARNYTQLLLDILQKLNRRLHPGRAKRAECQATRVRLIERFGRPASPDHVRRAFRRELELLTATTGRPSSRTSRLALNAKKFIEANYERRTSLSTVATHLHVSPNYLSRIFRRETGLTLTSYIQRVRIDHARRLLAEGRESISEIAYRVGYRNYRDFYRNFVKHENASPREVRDRLSRAG
jgi:two-component system response regulator YesN